MNNTLYKTAVSQEMKRFFGAFDEASENILETVSSGDQGSARNAHNIIRLVNLMFWDEYILTDMGDMLKPHSVNEHHELVKRSATERSQLETYLAALRSLANMFSESYLSKTILSSYGLECLNNRAGLYASYLKELINKSIFVVEFLEEYLTWLEHAATLAMAYNNCAGTCEAHHANEEYEKETIDDYLLDIRVKAYTYLKLFQCDPSRASETLNKLNDFFTALGNFSTLFEQLYTSLEPKHIESIFNALTNKKLTASTEFDKRFVNTHELNEYMRQRVCGSIEQSGGFLHNLNDILNQTGHVYVGKLANEISDSIAFLGSKRQQETFTKQFESGKIWFDNGYN